MDEKTFKEMFPNFRPIEFKCPCQNCDGGKMSLFFMSTLQGLRYQIGFPLHINSGFRCPEYNASLENSSPKSQHMIGLAADISTITLTPSQKHFLVEKAFQRFTGVGIYKNFIHLDLRDPGVKSTWTG